MTSDEETGRPCWSHGRPAVPEASHPEGNTHTMTTDPNYLRQRIAEALLTRIKRATVSRTQPHDAFTSLLAANEYDLADAVLAVLPPPADRPAVYREAADALDAGMERFFTEWPDEPRNSPYALGKKDAADELRRLADEAQQQEPSVHGESVAHLAGLHDDEPAVDARQDGAQQ